MKLFLLSIGTFFCATLICPFVFACGEANQPILDGLYYRKQSNAETLYRRIDSYYKNSEENGPSGFTQTDLILGKEKDAEVKTYLYDGESVFYKGDVVFVHGHRYFVQRDQNGIFSGKLFEMFDRNGPVSKEYNVNVTGEKLRLNKDGFQIFEVVHEFTKVVDFLEINRVNEAFRKFEDWKNLQDQGVREKELQDQNRKRVETRKCIQLARIALNQSQEALAQEALAKKALEAVPEESETDLDSQTEY